MSLGERGERTRPDVVVIGGGVAGLSVAAALAPHARVQLLEREMLLASHASGHNAAIFRPLEHDETSAALARRSLAWLAELGEAPLLTQSGLLLPSSEPERVRQLAQHARAQSVQHVVLEHEELQRFEPTLVGGEARSGLFLPEGGVLDLHALTSRLAETARAHGAVLKTGAPVARIQLTGSSSPRVAGILLRDGTVLATEHVVIAAGAWSAALGGSANALLPLTPLRRHLVQLRAGALPGAVGRPIVWRLEDEIYYRPESGGLLASPCDATPWPAESPASDPAALDLLAHKLARLAPSLASSRVQRAWACLRTFAPDGELVAGEDPRIPGLHWLSGLGGRGMSVAPAAGELVARTILGGEAQPLADALSPRRVLCAAIPAR